MVQTPTHITPIILCGGFGSRLWPLSREDYPKQFLSFGSKHSLFQSTIARMQGKHGDKFVFDKPVIATSSDHRFLVAEQLRRMNVEADILLEPLRRDSAAAVLAAANFLVNRKRPGLCMVVASDHAIPDVSLFHDHIAQALMAAHDKIVLFGIQPEAPSTDYGYISPGDELVGAAPVRRVAKFAEKPTASVAEIYIAKGYLWNSGNFICDPKVLLQEADLLSGDIAGPVAESAKNMRTSDVFHVLEAESFAKAKSLSIDFAVLEKTTKAAVLPSHFPWSDLGTWKAIHASMVQDEHCNAGAGHAVFTRSKNALVLSENKMVVVEGLKDVVVSVTDDAILVAHLDTGANMKLLVDKMKQDHPQLLKKTTR